LMFPRIDLRGASLAAFTIRETWGGACMTIRKQ
jgi:hypothetical protein